MKNPLDPELCQHKDEDLSHPRGGRNQTFWITCLRCGSRWERVQAPPSPPCSSGSAKVVEEEFVKVEAPMTSQQQTSLTAVFEMYMGQSEMTAAKAIQQTMLQASNDEEMEMVMKFSQTIPKLDRSATK